MGIRNLFKFSSVLLTVVILMINSCVPSSGVRNGRVGTKAKSTDGGSSGGKDAGASEDPVSVLDTILENGSVDIVHIVDPFDGTYKKKVTIPKNYKGLLYLSGLNVTSLNGKLVTVKFKFGREYETVELPAVVGRAPGITPDTDIEVLIIDMESQPFSDLRLLYDLFDYTDYDVNEDGITRDGIEFGAGDETTEPVTDNRASGLYCRGLRLEDDPTFSISPTNSKCDAAGEKCLYAYAKVLDSGLYYDAGGGTFLANIPTEPAIDLGGTGYANESQSELLKKCLPDVNVRSGLEASLQTTLSSASPTVAAYGDTGFAGAYSYLGPYRTSARSTWEISGDALFSDIGAGGLATGLFQYKLSNSPIATPTDLNAPAEGGIKSFLFPRAGKLTLQNGVEYLGYTSLSNALTSRSIMSLVSSGQTEWVDGCNIRVSNYDSFTNEGIGSCNVSATIEVYAKDPKSSTEELVTVTKQVKLQLTRPSATDYQGKEVLYSSMKTCTNSKACGANECCFNNRCWGKELVSQCLDDVPGQGNFSTGQNCSSDFQCSSLCCNTATGKCADHSTSLQVYCGKSPGQQCITKEFCRKENIQQCFVVKTGTNNQGQQTCALRCYNVPTHGDCRNGVCTPPPIPEVPTFDPANPDCSGAVDPPTNF